MSQRHIFGRRIQPLIFLLAMTMIIVAQSNFRGLDRGTEPPLSYFVASAATISVIAFAIGWWNKRQQFIEFGLLLVVLAYISRAAFISLTQPWDQAIFFSLATAMGAGLAYYMERTDRPTERVR